MPILAVGLDSFDTPLAGCTTHLASLLLGLALREGAEPADYPWLVRLNPAVPWKTRGNASVALLLRVASRGEGERLARSLARAAMVYAEAGGHRKPSLVALLVHGEGLEDYLSSRPPCLGRLYRRALRDVVTLGEARSCLAEAGAAGLLGPEARGLVGALAALGADFTGDFTFELLAYRRPGLWGQPRRVDPETVVSFDLETGPLTFSNYDYEADRPLVAPHGPDPVLYGVRGEEPEPLLHALEAIDAGEEPSHWVVYRSNQATNQHLAPRPARHAAPYRAMMLWGVIEERPRRLPGGHVVARVRDHTGSLEVAAYRETGPLRRVLEGLEPGAEVSVAGVVKPQEAGATLNLELLSVDGGPTPPYRPCGLRVWQPPLASLHHLAMPLERCRYRGEKLLRPPRRVDRVAGGFNGLP
ncbi:MAG: DUF1743 domain-containing protein [Crenarchaeota archaeon]|nr:DUF1743 domain-containing protein [Thermoproteota archaeon]